MSGIAHLGVGLAAKPVARKAPLGVLLVATETIDILWGVFFLVGLDSMEYAPWSHSLFMSAIWSLTAALLAVRLYHDYRTGALIGLLVFSHWVLDFITHPMSGGPPDLPLFFAGSPKVGLGLYTAIGPNLTMAFELGLPLLGVVVYLIAKGVLAPQWVWLKGKILPPDLS